MDVTSRSIRLRPEHPVNDGEVKQEKTLGVKLCTLCKLDLFCRNRKSFKSQNFSTRVYIFGGNLCSGCYLQSSRPQSTLWMLVWGFVGVVRGVLPVESCVGEIRPEAGMLLEPYFSISSANSLLQVTQTVVFSSHWPIIQPELPGFKPSLCT